MKEAIQFTSEISGVVLSVVFISGDVEILREDVYKLFGSEKELKDKIYNLAEVVEIGKNINKEITEEFYVWAQFIINTQGMGFEDVLNKLL